MFSLDSIPAFVSASHLAPTIYILSESLRSDKNY
jgi:hypothetical protein